MYLEQVRDTLFVDSGLLCPEWSIILIAGVYYILCIQCTNFSPVSSTLPYVIKWPLLYSHSSDPDQINFSRTFLSDLYAWFGGK
ncbi:uncharacterized protein YALI1_D35624g [Yarrowia lipolytica]|uniref:Uncharacterized protein n=1 Tax=Yarrowia lipolytica TaxID=4952 RepID=A0A1D8NGD9_YARLL|nr:hypothetical protein YALI1_D35624g [Yarrowia lipolytica]